MWNTIYDPSPGSDIREVILIVLRKAKQAGEGRGFLFNGRIIRVSPEDTCSAVLACYEEGLTGHLITQMAADGGEIPVNDEPRTTAGVLKERAERLLELERASCKQWRDEALKLDAELCEARARGETIQAARATAMLDLLTHAPNGRCPEGTCKICAEIEAACLGTFNAVNPVREAEQAVVRAADRLSQCMSEFPDYPAAWGEWLDAMDDALRKCPGTATHYMRYSDPPVRIEPLGTIASAFEEISKYMFMSVPKGSLPALGEEVVYEGRHRLVPASAVPGELAWAYDPPIQPVETGCKVIVTHEWSRQGKPTGHATVKIVRDKTAKDYADMGRSEMSDGNGYARARVRQYKTEDTGAGPTGLTAEDVSRMLGPWPSTRKAKPGATGRRLTFKTLPAAHRFPACGHSFPAGSEVLQDGDGFLVCPECEGKGKQL